MELTPTVQESVPLTVVTVMPPPKEVKLPVRLVLPATEGVMVKAIVELPEELSKVALGVPKLVLGPLVERV
jgi:hypothetical protein